MMTQLLFYAGNTIAIIGGIIALFWVSTSRRFYWRRRRRGIAALVFIAVGVFLMVSASSGSESADADAHGYQTPIFAASQEV